MFMSIPKLTGGLVCLMFGTWTLAGEPGGPDSSRIDEILTRLEKRSEGLKDIRCQVKFVEDDRLNLAKRTKSGKILVLMTDPNAHFLIHFEETEADGVLGKQEWYLFDGQWLYQGLERIKQVTKQEIAKPGEKKDMFDLENAPFPVPFGQKKDTILRNFDVTLAAPAPGDPAETDHLVCIPKPGSRMDRKYDKLELFVLREVNLPGRIVVTKNDGQEINVANFPDLTKKSINAGVVEKDLAKPTAWQKDGYTEVVEPMEQK